MKTFDYESAWLEMVRPAFDVLSETVKRVYERVTRELKGVGQLANLNTPWPEDNEESRVLYGITLREAFEVLSDHELALSAHVIHAYGHWFPGSEVVGPDVPRGTHGEHWKYANLASQVLAKRINETLDPAWPTVTRGIGFKIHDGVLRVQCATRYNWQWEEICLATRDSWDVVKSVNKPLFDCSADEFIGRYEVYMNELKYRVEPLPIQTDKYMMDEQEMKDRQATRIAADPRTRLRAIERINKEYVDKCTQADKSKEHAQIERDAKLWCMEHGVGGMDNLIYYSHTGRFCFGWSKPITGEAKVNLLAKLDGFQWPYDIEELSWEQKHKPTGQHVRGHEMNGRSRR